MRAGRLRHRLTLYRSTTTEDDPYGQPSGPRESLGERSGEVRPLRGDEAARGKQVQAEATHNITLRFDPDLALTPQMEADYKGRTFRLIQVINVNERDRQVEILAAEKLSGA